MTTLPADNFCPYKGLQPYTEADCKYFFGRKRDQGIIISNLYASRLTVFYGASGVGKSSVLLAGVVPSLKQDPRTAVVVVFNSWQSEDFLAALKHEVAKQAGATTSVDEGLALDEFLAQTRRALSLPLFLIFDQFEEYFLYHPPGPSADAFEAEFARAVNRRNVEVNFLLSLREDGLSKLDRFQGRLPKLLNNMLRLEHLDRGSAKEAITEPLRVYNQDPANSNQPMAIEPALVEKLLDELQAKNVLLEQTGQGQLVSEQGQEKSDSKIETSVLQMVLTRLWQEELAKQSGTLRLQTFQDLGGTKEIARTHLEREMQKLNAEEQQAASSVLRFLVTPSGAKIAQQPSSLVEWAGLPQESVYGILKQLSGPEMRILRKVEAPGQPEQFEVFHDVLARAILGWRAGYEEVQSKLRAERQVAVERAQERSQLQRAQTRARHFRWGAIGLSVILVAMLALLYLVIKNKSVSRSRELAAYSVGQLEQDPELSLLLGIEAANVSDTSQARDALMKGLGASHLKTVLKHGGPTTAVRGVAFSPQGDFVATATWDDKEPQNNGARVWKVTGEPVAQLQTQEAPVASVAFSSNGDYLVTAGKDSTARVWADWQTNKPREVVVLREPSAKGFWAASFSRDGRYVVTAGSDGIARVYDWQTESERNHPKEFRLPSPNVTPLPSPSPIPKASQTPTPTVKASPTPEDNQSAPPTQSHMPMVFSVAFSPNGKYVVVAGQTRTAQVWEWQAEPGLNNSIELKGELGSIYNAAFSAPDGKYIVTAGQSGMIGIWDWQARGEQDRPVLSKELRGSLNAVRGAAFSPNGQLVVTASMDNIVRLWDWQKWKAGQPNNPVNLNGHESAVFCVAFSPDPEGAFVVTGSEDGTARVWRTQNLKESDLINLSVDRLVQRARERVTRSLTAEEKKKYLDQ